MSRRVFRRRRQLSVEPQPDGLPKTGLFTEPLVITRLDAQDPEQLGDGTRRASFLVEIRDAAGQRCPDVAVEARVEGPERAGTVIGNTDMLGRVRFRMAGPVGRYEISVRDVGAGGLAWDPESGPRQASTTLT